MWFGLAKMALKTGSHIYQNRQKTKAAMSDAALHACRTHGARRGILPGQTFRIPR